MSVEVRFGILENLLGQSWLLLLSVVLVILLQELSEFLARLNDIETFVLCVRLLEVLVHPNK